MAASRAQIDSQRVAVAVALLAALSASVVTVSLFLWPSGDARDDDPLRPRSLFSARELAPGEVRTFAFTEESVIEVTAGRRVQPLDRTQALRLVHVVRLDGGELRAFDARSPLRGCLTVWRELSVPGFDRGSFFLDVCSGAVFAIDGGGIFGPAPRGLDRVQLEVRDGLVVVDPSRITRGDARPRGSRSTPTPLPTAAHGEAVEEPSAGY